MCIEGRSWSTPGSRSRRNQAVLDGTPARSQVKPSLTRKRTGVRIPQRPPREVLFTPPFRGTLIVRAPHAGLSQCRQTSPNGGAGELCRSTGCHRAERRRSLGLGAAGFGRLATLDSLWSLGRQTRLARIEASFDLSGRPTFETGEFKRCSRCDETPYARSVASPRSRFGCDIGEQGVSARTSRAVERLTDHRR
jgi:hypothetical protein